MFLQMEVIVGDFGIVVVPRDAADTDRIMNHSSILRKYRVSPLSPTPAAPLGQPRTHRRAGLANALSTEQHPGGEGRREPSHVRGQFYQEQVRSRGTWGWAAGH